MFNDQNYKKKWLGAAIGAGVAGSLAILLTFSLQKNSNNWIVRLKNIRRKSAKRAVNHPKTLGSLTGGLIGAAAALLLAPKSGKELLRDLYHSIARSLKSRSSLVDQKGVSKEKLASRAKSKQNSSSKKAAPKNKKEQAKGKIKKTRRSPGHKIISSADILPKEA